MKLHFDIPMALLCTVAVLIVCGCKPRSEGVSTGGSTTEVTSSASPKMTVATATLTPTQGHGVKGMVTFTKVDNGVRVGHEGKDDLTSQPSGDAGARVACGVIEITKK